MGVGLPSKASSRREGGGGQICRIECALHSIPIPTVHLGFVLRFDLGLCFPDCGLMFLSIILFIMFFTLYLGIGFISHLRY